MNSIKTFANRKRVAQATGRPFYHDVASGKTVTGRKEPALDKAFPAKGPFTNYESQITFFFTGMKGLALLEFKVPGSRFQVPGFLFKVLSSRTNLVIYGNLR